VPSRSAIVASNVFDRMLQSACKEPTDDTIRMQGFDDFVLRAMLEHMYTGRLPSFFTPGKCTLLRDLLCNDVCDLAVSPDASESSSLKTGEVVNVVEVKELAEHDRVRGRISDPACWITLGRLSDMLPFVMPEQKANVLLSLSQLADMYDIPDLGVACTSQLLKDMVSQPTQENVRRVADATKKRPRTDAGDSLLRIVKRKMQSNPDAIEAFLNDM